MHDGDGTRGSGERPGHLACPHCAAYDVERLFVASLRMDSCHCLTCGRRWDEELDTGHRRRPTGRASVLIQRET